MGGSSKKQTIGYKYFLGSQLALCHGPVDGIFEIQVDRRVAWEGLVDVSSTITVDAPTLFGGDSREGGISGPVSFQFGLPSQTASSYLENVIGEDLPAYRGVLCAVLEQCYMGNNPYLKPWAFKVGRTSVTTNGDEIWYVEKAAVGNAGIPVVCCDPYGTDLSQFDETLLPTTVLAPILAAGFEFGVNDVITLNEWTTISQTDFTDVNWGYVNLPAMREANGRGYVEPYERCQPNRVWWPEYFATGGDPGDPHIRVSGFPTGSPKLIQMILTRGSGNSPIGGTLVDSLMRYEIASGGLAPVRCIAGLEVDTTSIPGTERARITLTFNAAGNAAGLRLVSVTAGSEDPDTYTVNNFDSIEIIEKAYGPWMDITLTDEAAETFNIYDQWIKVCYTDVCASETSKIYARYEDDLNTYDGAYFGVLVSINFDVEFLTPSSYFANPNGLRKTAMAVSGYVGLAAGSIDIGGTLQRTFIPDTWQNDVIEGQAAVAMLKVDPPGGCEGFPCEEEGGPCLDMNPAHIIYECLTNGDWGLGYLPADVDETSFEAAADKLFEEVFGLSVLWSREIPIEDFISDVLRHIDAVIYVSRSSGKFVLKLIRDDYVESQLLTLDESNCIDVRNAKRPTVSELTNSVTVQYVNGENFEDGSLTVHNQALRQIQGQQINATIQYPGISSDFNAQRVAARDLKALSTPLLTCEITANREAQSLNPGDPFRLVWPDMNIGETVMRATEIDYGDGIQNQITIFATEDAFALPTSSSYSSPPAPGAEDELTGPVDKAVPRAVQEAPYYEVVQFVGQLQADTELANSPDLGSLSIAGGRQNSEINATLVVDDTGGGTFESRGIMDFSPYARVDLPIGYTDTLLVYSEGKDLGQVTTGTIAQMGDELVRVDAINGDDAGGTITVARGVLDTVPQPIEATGDSIGDSAGAAYLIFWGDFNATDGIDYAAGETISVKLLTNGSVSQLAADDAPTDAVTMNSRAIRPYPVGDLRVNGLSYPDDSTAVFWDEVATVSWTHRDRTQQTSATIFDYTAGDIGPEPGVTYRVEALALDLVGDETLFFSRSVGQATTCDIEQSDEDSNFTAPPVDTVDVKLQVVASRDGYDNWQSAFFIMPYSFDSVGDSIGDSVGDSIGDSIGFDSSGRTDYLFLVTTVLLPGDGPDAATTTDDFSPNDLPITFFNTSQIDTAQKKFGSASIYFPATTDYVQIGSDASFWKFLHDGTTNYTVDFWFRPGSVSGSQRIMGTYFTDGSQIGFRIWANGSSVIAYIADGDISRPMSLSASSVLSVGTWTHIAVVVGPKMLRAGLFIDGVQRSTAAMTNTFSSSDPTGGMFLGRGSSAINNGHIDDFRITKGIRYTGDFVAPTEAAAQQAPGDYGDEYWNDVELFLPFEGIDGATNAWAFYEISPGGHDREAGTNPAIRNDADDLFGTGAAEFNGTSHFIQYGQAGDWQFLNSGTEDFTVEAWISIDVDDSVYRPVLDTCNDGFRNGMTLSVYQRRVVYTMGSGGAGTEAYLITTGQDLTVDQWHHVAVVFDSVAKEMRCYIDGVLADTDAERASPTDSTPYRRMTVGRLSAASQFYDGRVNNIRITRGAKRYTSAFTPPTEPFPRSQYLTLDSLV